LSWLTPKKAAWPSLNGPTSAAIADNSRADCASPAEPKKLRTT